tara:strand:+ start:281 stop:568 length:288 start_codon:yes stop_codon:yes gene_type:complete
MIDTDEKVFNVEGWKELKELIDARTVEEDMETRNNMTWLNNRVVELEAEVKKMRGLIKNSLTYIECIPRTSDTIKLKFLIDDIRRYVLHEGGEEE